MAVENFVNDFIRGLQAGQQQKQFRLREAQEQEDRSVRRMLLDHQLRTMKVEDKMRARQAQLGAHELRDGQPESMFPITAGVTPTPNAPPTMFNGTALPGQSFGLQATRRIDPTVIAGVEEYGIPETRLMPQTAEQRIAALREAERNKVREVSPGEAVYQGSERIAYNPPNTPRGSLQQQYVDALRDGDREGAARILRAIKDTSAADDRPAGSGGDGFKFPNSNFGVNLRIAVADAEARLGRKLDPSELRQIQLDTLKAQVGGGNSPRGSGAIPQGVERYILDMRRRGYAQSQAVDELFSPEVWANMQRDHPSMTAERARAAIAQLIPEIPLTSGDDDLDLSGSAGAPPPPPPGADDRTMTTAEVQAAARRMNISEAEARRGYEARGFVIR